MRGHGLGPERRPAAPHLQVGRGGARLCANGGERRVTRCSIVCSEAKAAVLVAQTKVPWRDPAPWTMRPCSKDEGVKSSCCDTRQHCGDDSSSIALARKSHARAASVSKGLTVVCRARHAAGADMLLDVAEFRGAFLPPDLDGPNRFFFMARVPFLAGAGEAAARAVAALCVPARLAAGAMLYRVGDVADRMFLIEEGDVVVSGPAHPDGKALRGPGDVVGERAVVDWCQGRAGGLRAEEAAAGSAGARVYALGTEGLVDVLARHPGLRDRLMRLSPIYCAELEHRSRC